MNLLTQPQLLSALAEHGVHISRQLLQRSLHPLMGREGFAQKMGDGPTSMWVYDGNLLWRWTEYLEKRQTLIELGKWHSKRPYNIDDMSMLVDEGLYDGEIDHPVFRVASTGNQK